MDASRRTWARWVLAVSGVQVSVHGGENLDARQSYVFCANHLSFLDPPLLLAALPVPVRFVAKKSLFAIPLFGWAMRRSGEVPIDREHARAAARAVSTATEALRRGRSLAVFPEGSRSRDGELQPFLRGAVRMAVQAQAPVVPVAIRGSREALRPGSLYIRGGPICVRIGRPIPTANLSSTEREHLAEQVRRAVGIMINGNRAV
jgi:1-acyl-sn-glycerol-3-phosphate acyltransferase